ncbi:odorant receptor 131-2-like [Denticeps clupeoides]|uniref:odorant receptor 131-2-like n=1 Tax=Denticeps clupeoides TaxID=299321 RepID=UPI0010A333F8|nr:odorant receptor 131-2-like [Denticeps clupeoides]
MSTNDSNQYVRLRQNVFNSVAVTVMVIMSVAMFTYINSVMLFALQRKAIFRETPRYILFTHLLCSDTINLIFSFIVFILAVIFIKIAKAVCSVILFLCSSTFINSPLYLSVMSLERYVAICFPLRHSEIATQKKTSLAVIIIWFLGTVNSVIDILFTSIMDPTFFTSTMICKREGFIITSWQGNMAKIFNASYFVVVAAVILFTYISIIRIARSVSSDEESAKKPQKTVLLHLVQLVLCLNSFLYAFIDVSLASISSGVLLNYLLYLNFLVVLILPRCLSPLIYGLRDEALKPFFFYYFTFHIKKVKPRGNIN